jgi:hypothetical protein
MLQRKVNDIIYEIAQEEGITYKEAKNIIKSHFLFARIKLALGNPKEGKDTFKQVRLPIIGNFVTYDRKIKAFMESDAELTERQLETRAKYREWEMLNKKNSLTPEEKETLAKLIKIEI